MAKESTEVRIDKWLWAVRAYKSRSDAAEACRLQRVTIGGSYAKPSRDVKVGDVVTFKRGLVTHTYRVLVTASSRVGAKLVETLAEDMTPASELEKLQIPRETIFIQRDRGAGRPTKRDRREIDSLMEELEYDDE